MKPIALEMTAFGPYAKPTTVDFRKLNQSLYLITGDTGAGKTTIFDGIMFALYGVASGKGEKKNRTFDMMHCVYVDKSQDTVIGLEFEHMGKSYTVERTLHFKKKRDSGEYEKTTPAAKLWEPDRWVQEKSDAVTERITELLGMNAEQFRKIVMLAQGEFKRFLDADSEEKNKILGELFDNSAYVYFQDLFERARKNLKECREKEIGRAKDAMERFLLPEEITGEEEEIYAIGACGEEGTLRKLKEVLKDLAQKDEKLKAELEEKFVRIKEWQKKQNTEFGRAQEQNKKLDELAAGEKEVEILRAKREEISRLEQEADRVDKAFYKVWPKREQWRNAGNRYRTAVERIQKLQMRLAQLQAEKTVAENTAFHLKEGGEPEIARLGVAIAEIEKAIPKYEDLREKIDALRREKDQMEIYVKTRQGLAEQEKKILGEIEELERKISALSGIGASVERCKIKFERAVQSVEKLTGKDGVGEWLEKTRVKEAQLKKEEEGQIILNREAGEENRRYHEIYQAFINGQAGEMAKNLEKKLQEAGEAVCPVCQTVIHANSHHAFKEFGGEIFRQEDVDRAKADFERKDRAREEGAKNLVKLEAELSGLKEKVKDRLREFHEITLEEFDIGQGSENWKNLEIKDNSDIQITEYLARCIAECRTKEKERKEKYEEVLRQREEEERWKGELQEKKDVLCGCREELERCKEREQAHRGELTRLEAAIEELKRNLDGYPDKNTAKEAKEALEMKRKNLQEKIKKAEEDYQGLEGKCKEIAGALKSGQNDLPGLKEECDNSEKMLSQVLTECGFESWEGARGALFLAGETERAVEDWLKRKQKEIADYKNTWNHTEEYVKKLRGEVGARKRADLEELRAEIERLEEEQDSVLKRLEICKRQTENHRETMRIVGEASGILTSTQSAWERLDFLAGLAGGTRNSAGGRLSFDRYVMGYVFCEILEMANRRLDTMSGGRYELVHERNAGRENAKAGLEISVLDMTTGKCRPSASLSGGESFFASLALALGLSDVVQNHAGGKVLDALFIDEGFGSLDHDMLDRALSVLGGLTEGKMVGIISHVERLRESIPQQIRVKVGERGSFLEVIS